MNERARIVVACCVIIRAIRAEENLRHFAVTGNLLDSRPTIKQIIGLRFASDAEIVELARKAAYEGLSQLSRYKHRMNKLLQAIALRSCPAPAPAVWGND